MTVVQLIEMLSKCDPQARVVAMTPTGYKDILALTSAERRTKLRTNRAKFVKGEIRNDYLDCSDSFKGNAVEAFVVSP